MTERKVHKRVTPIFLSLSLLLSHTSFLRWQQGLREGLETAADFFRQNHLASPPLGCCSCCFSFPLVSTSSHAVAALGQLLLLSLFLETAARRRPREAPPLLLLSQTLSPPEGVVMVGQLAVLCRLYVNVLRRVSSCCALHHHHMSSCCAC